MRTVEDAMTVEVITVGPDEPVSVAVKIMRDVGVGGLPVVDASGGVVGILTDADRLHGVVAADPSGISGRRGKRNRSWGRTIADVMSRDVLGVRRDTPLEEAARLMEKARVRRLVVVGRGGELEGIITRSDVAAALARPDADIEAEIRSCVVGEVLGLDPDEFEVAVDEGVVTMAGVVGRRREAVRLERLAGEVRGVSRVESSVTWRTDADYPGLVPRFAYFAKYFANRRQGSRGRTASSAGAGSNNESTTEPMGLNKE